jgi:sirohydrochlorin ferrochelatase
LAGLVRQALQAKSNVLRSSLAVGVAQTIGTVGASMRSQALNPFVGTAVLEFGSMPLHEQIHHFSYQAQRTGCNRVQIVPLFLLPGTHVQEDIPTEVAIAQQTLNSAVTLDLRPYLGSHPGLADLVQASIRNAPETTWILLAHGSQRPGGNIPVEGLVSRLQVFPAYWSVPPTLSQRVKQLVQAGHFCLGIVPYFLFAGGITDAIAQTIADLQRGYPGLTCHCLSPLGVTPQLAHLIADLTLA